MAIKQEIPNLDVESEEFYKKLSEYVKEHNISTKASSHPLLVIFEENPKPDAVLIFMEILKGIESGELPYMFIFNFPAAEGDNNILTVKELPKNKNQITTSSVLNENLYIRDFRIGVKPAPQIKDFQGIIFFNEFRYAVRQLVVTKPPELDADPRKICVLGIKGQIKLGYLRNNPIPSELNS